MWHFLAYRLAACLWILPAGVVGSDLAPDTEREVEWLAPTVHFTELAVLRREALARLPISQAVFPAEVELDPPRQTGRRTLLSGRYTVQGAPVARSHFVMIFNKDGKWFAFLRPRFSREALAAYPGPAAVSREQAERTLGGITSPGSVSRLAPLTYWVEAGRWVHPAWRRPNWDLGVPGRARKDWQPEAVLMDGVSGEVFHRELMASDLSVSGACAGYCMAREGPGVRRAYGGENKNLPAAGPLPFMPVQLSAMGGDKVGPVLSSFDGSFALHSEGQGLWGLGTHFDTIDFSLTVLPGAQSVHAEATGVGDAAQLELDLGPSMPTDLRDLDAENRTGVTTGWIYLHLALEFAQLLQQRNLNWPAGFGGKQEYVRAMPAFYNLRLVRLPVESGEKPGVAGAHFDAFPPDRLLGISEGNDLFHDWTNPAIWHEFGHAVVSAFTGQINDPPPNQHDETSEECVADMFALFMMQFLDPGGEIPYLIGEGIERGYTASFHRDVKHGLVCYPPPGHCVPCRARGGFGLYPPASEAHEGSLVFSGFFHDLWESFAARYGRIPGFLRVCDHFVRYIDLSRGDKLSKFALPTVMEIITINDDEYFGGDDIPQNGSPDLDLIVDAAARRNLWLHRFTRGDVNQDGGVDVSDAIAILAYLFLGAADPDCLDAADTNDDAKIELPDAVHLVVFLFNGGPELPSPARCEGLDPTPGDRLTCISYSACK